MSARRVIKKYANRRLYDTEASKHVTLTGIRNLIVEGLDIQILDDTSGEDITRALLLQIIVEQEQSESPLLPEVLLAQLIRFYGNPMQNMMGDYLLKSVGAFLTHQENVKSQMQTILSNTPMDTMQELMRQNMSAWESMLGSGVASDTKTESK